MGSANKSHADLDAMRNGWTLLILISSMALSVTLFCCESNRGNDGSDDDAGDDVDDDAGEGQEPLAVISCDRTCADTGEVLSFSGEDSQDPQNSELTYEFDFGDGDTSTGITAEHAYSNAGAYRVILTVTNEFDLKDQSSCIVSVGNFTTGVGNLNEIGFSRNHYNPLIQEDAPLPEHGGLIYGFFVASSDATPDTIIINGQPADPALGEVEWCEIIQTELHAGDIGILRCHSYSENFDPGEPISLEVRDGSNVIWSINTTIPNPTLTPSYITSTVDEDEILVFVRNDSNRALKVTGLSMNGLDVSDFVVIDNSEPKPNELSIIHVPRCDGVPFGEWLVFTVHGTDGKESFSVSRSLRLFKPIFPIGDWNSDDVFTDTYELERCLDVGINMFIWDPAQHSPETVLALAEDYDFYLFTHKGDTDQAFEDFVVNYGDNPRILTNAVSGEGEFGGVPIDALQKLRHHRELWGSAKPMWVYNACSYQFPSWGALADISGMDHYCVWAPKCNTNWPIGNWDKIEFAGYYAEEIKIASEPRPSWCWTQAAWSNWESRCTTPDEIRSQWYQVISRGTKGMLWFLVRNYWFDSCPKESIDELKKLADELAQIKEFLLEGDIVAPGIVAFSDMEKVDVRTTISPKAIVIFLTNLDYDLNLVGPFTWHEKYDVPVFFDSPNGFEPLKFLMIDGTNQIELETEKIDDNLWRVTVPILVSAAPILVVSEP